MRVTTAFNRMLGLPGAWVRDVEFGEQAVIVTVALRRKQPICSGCGARGLKIKDHRVKRWRHLDAGGVRCVIECRLRRLYCPGCGDLPEHVEWARGAARYTRDFDDLVAWLAQQMNQTQVTKLMRIGWETVGNIITRVVAEKLPAGRLDGLRLIGVDEVNYGADHKFLTCVANHESGGIVWATEGRNSASLQAFFDGLTDEQKASIKAVSIDMSAGYEKAIRAPEGLPHAQVCFDPLPRRPAWRQGRRPGPPRRVQPPRPLCHRRGQVDQRHALQPAQGHRQADHRAAAQARRGRAHQQADVPRVPALRRAALHLQAAQRRGRRAARRVALLGIPLAAETVRQARPHDPQTQSRRAGCGRARVEQRTARSVKQQGKAPVTPRLRIPLRRRADRDDLPLLRRHPNRAPSPISHPQTERRAP